MTSQKPLAPQRNPSANLVVLAHGSELVLTEADSAVLVVRGACHVRSAGGKLERVNAGSVLLGRATQRKRDPRVARALELMRSHPEQRWTVERLARKVGLSRAAFTRRFAALTGTSPLRHLTELRLALAAACLAREDEIALAALAARVGYRSEFAFSRAFKRRYGIAPSIFRRTSALPAPRTLALAA